MTHWRNQHILSFSEFIRDSKGSIFYIALANISISVCSLALPLFVLQIYDRVIPSQSNTSLLWLSFGTTIAIALDSLTRYSKQYLIQVAACKYEHKIYDRAYDAIIFADLANFDADHKTAYLDKISDISKLRHGKFTQFFEIAFELPFYLLYLYFLIKINPWIATISCTIHILALLITGLNVGLHRAYNKKKINTHGQSTKFAREVFSKIHDIKAFSIEEPILAEYEKVQRRYNINNLKLSMFTYINSIFNSIIPQVVQFVVIGVGAILVYRHQLSFGLMISAMIFSGRAIALVLKTCSYIVESSEISRAINDIREIFSLKAPINGSLLPAPSHIAGHCIVENLSFSYSETEEKVFENLDLNIMAGTHIAIRPNSERGTSTLLRLMSGRMKPNAGKVYLDDYDIHSIDPKTLRGTIEVLNDNQVLLDGDILDNISSFDPNLHAASVEASGMIDLDSRIAKLDHGYTSKISSSANLTLPLSLIKSISLTNALASRPRVLMIDQFDDRIDLQTLETFLRVIDLLNRLCTMIVISDHPRVLEKMDKVFEIRNKRLEEIDIKPRMEKAG